MKNFSWKSLTLILSIFFFLLLTITTARADTIDRADGVPALVETLPPPNSVKPPVNDAGQAGTEGADPPNYFSVVQGKNTKVDCNKGQGPYYWVHSGESSPCWDTDGLRLKKGDGNGCFHYRGLLFTDGYYYFDDDGYFRKIPSASISAMVPMSDCKRDGVTVHGWWNYANY